MGLGDEILALGLCEAYYQQTGLPARIVDKAGRARHHDAWVGNPAYSPQADYAITDCPGARGYIKRWEGDRIIFNENYKARAGRIYNLPEIELDGEYILVNPHLKENASPNKRWPWHYWQELVKMLLLPVVQIGSPGDSLLDGARFFHTPSFKHAAAVAKKASLVITHEGGLHHMAASVNAKAAVLFGAFAPPQVLGYDSHINIAVGDEFCGNFSPCSHCVATMNSLTPEVVYARIYRL